METIGERIKKIREDSGLNPRQFALSVDINTSNYYKIEAGTLGVKTNSLQAISTKYGVDMNWMLTGKGEMYKSGWINGTILGPADTYKAESGNELRWLKEKVALMEKNVALQEKNDELLKTVASLRNESAILSAEIQSLKNQLNKK